MLWSPSGFAQGAEDEPFANLRSRLMACTSVETPSWCSRFLELLNRAVREDQIDQGPEWPSMPVAHNVRLCSSLLPPEWCNAFWARLRPVSESKPYQQFLEDMRREKLVAAGLGPVGRYSWTDIVQSVAQGNVTQDQLSSLRKAAQDGDTRALELLGWMYSVGQNVKQSYEQAYRYYGEAYLLGNTAVKQNMDAIWQWLEPYKQRELQEYFDTRRNQ